MPIHSDFDTVVTTFASEGAWRPKKPTFRKWLRQQRPVILTVVSGFLMMALIGSFAVASQMVSLTSGDMRSDASQVLGTASMAWPNSSQTLPAGVVSSLALTAAPGSVVIDGLQLVVNITGTNLPALTFEPNTAMADLEVAYAQVVTTATGQALQVAFVSRNPALGFNAQGQTLNLGQLRFTPTAQTTLSLAFDPEQTMVLEHSTQSNIIGSLVNTRYAFVVASSPTPSASPVSSPSPTPVVTPTPVPSPSVQPSPTPSPTTETIVVSKAVLNKYPWGVHNLQITASDSLGTKAALKVEGFGNMSYSSRKKNFSGNWYTTNGNLNQVVIVSSTGKKVTVPLQIRTVRVKWGR